MPLIRRTEGHNATPQEGCTPGSSKDLHPQVSCTRRRQFHSIHRKKGESINVPHLEQGYTQFIQLHRIIRKAYIRVKVYTRYRHGASTFRRG